MQTFLGFALSHWLFYCYKHVYRGGEGGGIWWKVGTGTEFLPYLDMKSTIFGYLACCDWLVSQFEYQTPFYMLGSSDRDQITCCLVWVVPALKTEAFS